MSGSKRPGGLTALAVLNFVFGGFSALGVLGMIVVIGMTKAIASEAAASGDPAAAELGELLNSSPGIFYLSIGGAIVSTFLLIASGVGYLQQKKMLGRTFGNAYGFLAIILTAVPMALVESDLFDFNLATVVGLIYPILTLALLNTTFREDFVN